MVTALLPADSCIVITHDIFAPNVFSPNVDGINDEFFISGDSRSVEKISYLRIFDRWGSLVFDGIDLTPNDPAKGWNGTMQKKDLNPGVFVWIAEIQFTDDLHLSFYGDITLMR
jgi:gliding motility-associated-like protein